MFSSFNFSNCCWYVDDNSSFWLCKYVCKDKIYCFITIILRWGKLIACLPTIETSPIISILSWPNSISLRFEPSSKAILLSVVGYFHPTRTFSLGCFLYPRQIRNPPKHEIFRSRLNHTWYIGEIPGLWWSSLCSSRCRRSKNSLLVPSSIPTHKRKTNTHDQVHMIWIS